MQPTATNRGGATAVDVDIGRTESGVLVRDLNTRTRCRIDIESRSHLRTADESAAGLTTAQVPVPVSTAVECLADGLRLPEGVVVIRDREGSFLSRADEVAFRNFTEGRYLLEFHGDIPCVVWFESGFTLGTDGRTIAFDHESPLRIGARSARPRPTETVTTTGDPADVMAAVSTFGSALATRAPERSFPAFRGHPPALELGEELRVPDGLEPPERHGRIRLPERLEYAYAAAPLAAYLGVRVEPARRAELVTDSFSYSLDGRGGVEASLARVLKQVFVLDVACRDAGPSPGESRERRAVDAVTTLDWERLYEADPAARLAAYLSVPFHAIREAVPLWGSAAHVRPEPANAAMLPALVARFATVRSPPSVSRRPSAELNSPDTAAAAAGNGPARPAPSDAVEDLWVGQGAPVGATKALTPVDWNRFGRRPDPVREERTRSAAVLAPNPDEQAAAEAVAAAYDDPSLVVGLTRDDLQRQLTKPRGIVHLVGDVDEAGFDCLDGPLDAGRLDAVCANAFVMDCCSVHGQATALVEAGALGGVATVHEQPGEGAELGATLARLLAAGVPLSAATDVASDAGLHEDDFLVVGDGTATLPETGTSPPMVLAAESVPSGYAVQCRGYTADTAGMGSRTRTLLDDDWCLTTARERPTTVDAETLQELVSESGIPLLLDGDLVWDAEAVDA